MPLTAPPSTRSPLVEPGTHPFYLSLPSLINLSTSCEVHFLNQCWTIYFLSFPTVKVSSFINWIKVASELLPFIHSLSPKSTLHSPASVISEHKSDHTPPLLRELLGWLVTALKMKTKHLNMIWKERTSESGKCTGILHYLDNSENKNYHNLFHIMSPIQL